MKVVAESEDAVITQFEPKPKPAPKPAPTDAEIEERKKKVAELTDAAADSLFPNSVKPKPAVETPPKPTEEQPPKPAVETPPKPAAKKPASKPADKPPVDVEEVATRTARRVVEELAPKGDDLPEEVSELTPKDQRNYAVFQKMGESNKKYEKLAEQFVAFAKSKYDYEKKWIKENPGREFDPRSDEHEAFFKNQPAFDEDDYEDARDALLVKLATDEAIKKAIAPLEQARENERLQREVEPVMRRAVLTDTHSFVKGIAPELAAILTDKDGNVDWSPANLEKAEAADPIAADVLVNAIKGLLLPQLDTLHRMFTPGMIQTIDPKLPVYEKVWEEITNFEQVMLEPEAPKVRNGREFITLKQWGDSENKILSSKAPMATKQAKMRELESKFWTVDINDIRSVITRDVTDEVKKVIERRKQIAHKAFGKPGAAAPVPTPEARPKPADAAPKPAAKPQEKPSPPASAAGATQVSAETPTGTGDKKTAEIITEALFKG